MASNATSTTGGRLHLGTHVDGKRFAVGAGIVLAAVAVTIGVAAPGQSTDGQAARLNARSNALSQRYGLGVYATQPAPVSASQTALRLRSEALNRKHGLGASAVPAVIGLNGLVTNPRSAAPGPGSHAVGAYRAYETGNYATTLP
jgi:hypothetical protein